MSPDRGQIIWIDFNPRKGHEQAGRRPAVVISPKAYNEVSSCLLLCPITSNLQPWPWKVTIDGEPVSGAILVDQIKSIDGTARHMELTDQWASESVMTEVLGKLGTLTG